MNCIETSLVVCECLVKPAPTCPGSQFRCDNGECIHYQYVCNKNPDCSDSSDEPPHCCKLFLTFLVYTAVSHCYMCWFTLLFTLL